MDKLSYKDILYNSKALGIAKSNSEKTLSKIFDTYLNQDAERAIAMAFKFIENNPEDECAEICKNALCNELENYFINNEENRMDYYLNYNKTRHEIKDGFFCKVHVRILNEGLILIEPIINGYPLKLLFDTGASISSLKLNVAEKIGLKPSNYRVEQYYFDGSCKENPLAISEDFCFGEHKFSTNFIINGDEFYEIFEQGLGAKIDGVLGWSFIKWFAWKIDFNNEIITISKSVKRKNLPELLDIAPFPVVKFSINGMKIFAGLDTGSNITAVNVRLKDKFDNVVKTVDYQYGIGIEKKMNIYKIPNVTIEIGKTKINKSLKIEDNPMYTGDYFNYPAIIGCDTLKNHVVKIDYLNHAFSVEKKS